MLEMAYVPTYWPDLLTAGQNQLTLGASIYANCNVQALFNTLSALLTAEGSSTLVSRLAGGIIFELPNYYSQYLAAGTDFLAAQAIGKIFQVILNYSLT